MALLLSPPLCPSAQYLNKPRLEAITTEIERCFLDKVVPDVGLVLTLYEVVSIEGGFIFPGDGAPHFTVAFK